jgi:cytochrome c oxidase subunit 1
LGHHRRHKKIGILYIFTSLGIFLIAGILALIVRVELAQPGLQAVDNDTYNHLFTMHGTMMIFLFAAQISTGLANYGAPTTSCPSRSAPPTWPSRG